MTATDNLDRLFQVMADPYRRSVVERLCKGPASVSELASPAKFQLPAVVKHLKILEEGGIVVSQKSGRVRTYRMRQDAFLAMSDWIDRRQHEMHADFDRLANLMADVPEDKDH